MTDNMTNKKRLNVSRRELPVIIIYFSLYFIIGLSLLLKQPFGNPPDEFNRYLIPQYIAEHGTLPNGYDESIRIPAYGFSYAFQPILPYMAQGYFMRLIQYFTDDADILFYSARMVDFIFGLIMAVFVLLLSRKLFSDKRMRYLFCFLTTFLPQSIFLHTYVNTDSCCMMSISIMLYGLTCCLEDDFSLRSDLIMSAGIIFCALSYYNAYGYILSCILLFTAHFISMSNHKIKFDWKSFLKKGSFISIIVLCGIGWWFIRSYMLYDGDFLGLRTRDLCAALYGNADMKPDVRITYKSLGHTIPSMLFESDFFTISINSFICMYGPMVAATALWIYRFYKLIFLLGLIGCAMYLLPGMRPCNSERPVFRFFFHINMFMCILVPLVLSIIYSYGTDYQPQGRYLMPALIPLCFYCVKGLERLLTAVHVFLFAGKNKKPVSQNLYDHLLTGLCVLLVAIMITAILVTVYCYAFPYFSGLAA